MLNRILLTVIIIPLSFFIAAAQSDQLTIRKQSKAIQKIIACEKDENRKNQLIEIIDYVDTNYGDLYNQLKKGGKVTVYFGPAHGKDNTGEWRGTTTNRVGVSGLPEEYYSIQYSRKLYNMLKNNKFIRVVAKPEYQDVLDGKSESYHYMPFKEVMQRAKEADAFIVIEMHMNNVAIFNKADGLVNMPGIHMARDTSGRKMLINIKGKNTGFMTLYNKYDASGFSRQYAVNIRQSLVKKGYVANNWEFGAVADDRFTYYYYFPISVIYECGFISDIDEEKKLLTEEYMDGMVQSQYDMLLKTFKDMFGIDLSGDDIKITEKDFSDNIELLKLARIAIFYIQEADTSQVNLAIGAMKKNYYYGSHKGVIDYYSSIAKMLNNCDSLYNKGMKFKNKKKYSKARKYFVYAKNSLRNNELFKGYRQKYNGAIYGNRARTEKKETVATDKPATEKKVIKRPLKETSVAVKKAPVNRPVILIIRKNQSIDKSVEDALAADGDTSKKITESLRDYKVYSYKKVKQYSKKKKKNVWVTVKNPKKYSFYEGIYLVTLDKNLNVVKAERVSSVYLNPDKYQNQQYLKNSYFAETEREKDY